MRSFLSSSHPSRAAASSSSSHRRSRSQRAYMTQQSSYPDDDDEDRVDVEDCRLVHPVSPTDSNFQDHNEEFLCKPPANKQQKNDQQHTQNNPARDAFRKLAGNVNKSGIRWRNMFLSILFFVIVLLVFSRHIYVAWLRFTGVPPGLYSRKGELVIGRDTPFHIKGVSWYGMEEESHIFGGLSHTSIDSIVDFLKLNRFNAIRVPLSLENVNKNPESRIRNLFSNLEVKDSQYLDLLRHVIRKAAERHILILLDIHRIHNVEVKSPGLWYSEDFPERKLVDTWKKLCREFGNEWNVLGADLKNEPWNSTWNTGDVKTDWKRGSEVVGEALHTACPAWTLFVEGVGTNAGSVKSECFWSENLAAIQSSPPSLQIRKKVVLSPHVYGPSVFMQTYFNKSGFIERMPSIWDDHFGRASNISGLATVIGEWGGTFKGIDAAWQRKFFKYISNKGYSFFYWCLNPESGDTGGLLKGDWRKPEQEKINLIKAAPSSNVEDYIFHFQYWRSWAGV